MFKSEQNPFSFYDFLGYFIPGAAFLLAFDRCPAAPAVIHNAARFTSDSSRSILLFILTSYMAGHVLSFLSSIFVEKYAEWRYGYPSKYLLRFPPSPFWKSWEDSKSRCRTAWNNVLRFVAAVAILPITLSDLCVDWALERKHVKPLDPPLVAELKASLKAILGSEPRGEDGEDFLRSAYHVAVECAPAHLPKMQNYVALYGFVRVTSFNLVLMTWALALAAVWGARSISFWLPVGTAAGSFLFFLAFIKFYRRFSLEVLMATHALVLIRRWNGSCASDKDRHRMA